MRVLVFCMFLLVATTSYCEPVKDLKNAPTEVQLACMNIYSKPTANPDQAKVQRIKYLLNRLKSQYPDSITEIANWTVKAQGAMHEKKVDESILSILESISTVKIDRKLGKVPYKDSAIAYMMLRTGGMSNDEAATGINQLLKGVASTKK